MNWRELKENGAAVVGGAVSGGLDSCTVTHWLRENGFEVQAFMVDGVDMGQYAGVEEVFQANGYAAK